MDITYFNWYELLAHSRGDLAAIMCLAYAQSSEYNEKSTKLLMRKLNINHIPYFLIKNRTFVQYRHILVCNYKTKEPQSYFLNPRFLFINVPITDKIVYLRALSMRKPSCTNDYIPRKYYKKVKSNFFMRITEDNIYFPEESSIREIHNRTDVQ